MLASLLELVVTSSMLSIANGDQVEVIYVVSFTNLGLGLASIMQPDGRVVVLYSAYSTGDTGQVSELKLSRFNANGSVDSIF
jgi:hypothetical protein